MLYFITQDSVVSFLTLTVHSGITTGLLIWVIRLRRQLRRPRLLSMMDGLTSLPNRKGFELLLQKRVREARRSHQYLSVLLLNLDSFSQVNLTYGFDVGDSLLEQAAIRLKSALKQTYLNKTDTLCRWSSDEYVVLLRDIDPTMTKVTAELLRREIAKDPFLCAGNTIFVSISIGASELQQADDCTTFLIRAHTALKQAKTSGGNRCHFSFSE